MLIKNDDSIAICTPSKTGSTALEAALLKTDGYYKVIPRHRCDRFEDAIHRARRGIVIRNPLSRIVSAYWFLKYEKRGITWMTRCPSFDHFVNSMIDARTNEIMKGLSRPWKGDSQDRRLWVMKMVEYVEQFAPHEIFRLEQGLDKVAAWASEPDIEVKFKLPASDDRTKRGEGERDIDLAIAQLSKSSKLWLYDFLIQDVTELYDGDWGGYQWRW